jgi:hypothetical protein
MSLKKNARESGQAFFFHAYLGTYLMSKMPNRAIDFLAVARRHEIEMSSSSCAPSRYGCMYLGLHERRHSSNSHAYHACIVPFVPLGSTPISICIVSSSTSSTIPAHNVEIIEWQVLFRREMLKYTSPNKLQSFPSLWLCTLLAP